MKYKTVYMAHDVSALVSNIKGKMRESTAVYEMGDWDATLNRYAKEGWIVKKCATIATSKDVIFWALLKKREKQIDI
mgnify:CR=1 FL=1